ncbi:MAG TPA: DUF3150 domain-containing protein [Syntrophales bacterium]|nr:DUF3150 domain-containing protein [Candidatus Omnitrophota bacterium]MDX9820296.1 DUF3150 domain-containing protein [Syntrophales bacterium]HPJ97326.1 DUF3150 domain-containing protein [Syntrophales bacterium]
MSDNTQTINILDNIRIIMLDIRLWTGRRHLAPEDLKLSGKNLPPSSLVSLGSKLVIDPESLTSFSNLKRSAERAILAVGSKFLGGYAIPISNLDTLMSELQKLKEEFSAKKELFLAHYEEAVKGWITANPGWESVIENAAVDPDYVRNALHFSVQVFNVTPAKECPEGLTEEVTGLAAQLRREIQQHAESTWRHSFKGRSEVGQKALRPIRAMIKKIEGLVFLEPELQGLVNSLAQTLDAIPKKGTVKGRQLTEAVGILAILGAVPDGSGQFQAETENTSEEESSDETALPPSRPSQAERPAVWF